ncbi:unnamed protein product [Mytilus coruscus]|uniref:Ion transport domain-containing protein n=1 Tax=Mytilus coruscus TaxID=42192 RepID=A0A6J8B4G0_MYTCO|nr:unnamed protein product [Mytilus coruscus]
MAHKVKSARDQSFYDEMMEQFRLFAERALDLQRRLYDADANLAMDLVITEETVLDITISPLECAHENSMLDFIAETCPQRRLNKIWYNELGASLGGFWKILKEESILTKISPPMLQEDRKSSLHHSWWYFPKKYLFNFWNSLDYISYLITFAAISIRFFKSTTSNNLARRFYSLSLFTMYMRFLHVILMSRKLGPKIIMIKEMLKELFRFIGILFVFIMGVGVLYHANIYPKHVDMWNPAGWEYWRIWKIIYIPYWQIYGDSFLDTFSENSTAPCTTIQSEWENNPDIERCSQYDWVLIVIAALYMLISNLLLVNLVIALFRLVA